MAAYYTLTKFKHTHSSGTQLLNLGEFGHCEPRMICIIELNAALVRLSALHFFIIYSSQTKMALAYFL
jgi:hypothetical protein